MLKKKKKKSLEAKGKNSPHYEDHDHDEVAETRIRSHLKQLKKQTKHLKNGF